MSTDRLKAVVVGGSIAGLMAAIILRTSPKIAEVRILERTPESLFRDQGAGLGIRAVVSEFLDTYKPDDIPVKTFASTHIQMLNNDGSLGPARPLPPDSASTSWTALMTGLRQTLETKVKNGEDRDTVQIEFGSAVTGVEETGVGKVAVRFANESGTVTTIDDVHLVIGADGANSTVRRLMGLKTPRPYAGYCFYRGIVPTNEVPEEIVILASRGPFVLGGANHTAICYNTPVGMMWGSYNNAPEADLKDILTDVDGHTHKLTLPAGKMRPEVFESIKAWARENFPPQALELVEKGSIPSVQVMTDLVAEKNVFMDGKVLLVGEAIATVRPHVFAGTLATAYHALRLQDLLDGQIDVEMWGKNTRDYSVVIAETGVEAGNALLQSPTASEEEKRANMGKAMGAMMQKLTMMREQQKAAS